jgi:hypothetical protein
VSENIRKTNGDGESKPPTGEVKTSPVFKIDRSPMGCVEGFIGITERTVNGELGANEANAAAKSLMGVPAMLKVQLDALRLYEKGSEKAREHVIKMLG